MRKILFVSLIFVIAITLSGCRLFAKDEWQGVYYPDGCLICEKDYIYSPVFEKKEDCLNWGRALKAEKNNPADLYECGKNCKWKNELMICEETID